MYITKVKSKIKSKKFSKNGKNKTMKKNINKKTQKPIQKFIKNLLPIINKKMKNSFKMLIKYRKHNIVSLEQHKSKEILLKMKNTLQHQDITFIR